MKLLILSTPRTGSNALCDVLSSGKTLGHVDAFFAGYGANLHDEFDDKAVGYIGNHSYNGNFATKIMWDYLDHLAQQLKRPGFVADWLYDFDRVLWLYREDTVAQAVSWFFALGNGQWHTQDKAKREDPEYNYRQIAHHLGMIEGYNKRTELFVKTCPAEHLSISYEFIVGSTWQTMAEYLFAWLGLRPLEKFREPVYQKQSHPLKDEYIKRFRHDMVRAAHGA